MDITDAVKGRWPGILKTLGVPDEYLSKKAGPCPLCGGTDRYSFTNHNNDGIYLCRGCGNGNGWTFVQKYFSWDFRTAVEHIEPLVGLGRVQQVEVAPKKDPVPALRYVAKQCERISWDGSVGLYLRSRGFTDIPEGLRQASLAYYQDGKPIGNFDTLVSLVQDFEGNGVSYHLTYTKDGKKAELQAARKIMPPKGTISGAAVRLNIDFDDTICIAEGVETAYAAGEESGHSAFAALTAHGLETFIVPENVNSIWIYGDNDASFTGQASAFALAKRLRLEGKEAWVFIPEGINTDWSDLLNK